MLPIIISILCACIVVLVVLYFSKNIWKWIKKPKWKSSLKSKIVTVEIENVNDDDNDDIDASAPVAPVCGIQIGNSDEDNSDSDYSS